MTKTPALKISREFNQDSIDRIATLKSLAPNSHIHISGICGTGTASLLVLLKDLGFKVTGSDKAFYPPMGDVVREAADEVFEGYAAENFSVRPDMVLIGNALSANNPEVIAIHEQAIPFASMPEALAAFLIGEKDETRHSLVISGTHGKTTTTTLCTWLLECAGRKPGYFIGAMPLDLPASIRAVSKEIPLEQRVAVLEGDEYDSAYFSKYSKFHAYRPDIAIVTSLEFDHADIFQTLEDIEKEFLGFLKRVPADGLILCADSSPTLDSFLERYSAEFSAEVRRYGKQEKSEYQIVSSELCKLRDLPTALYGQELDIKTPDGVLKVQSSMSGEHNAFNLVASIAAAQWLGCSAESIAEGSASFRGIKRRQELVFEAEGIRIVEDFAHHPTAVETTLAGLKASYQPKRLIAVFEPRSNTSRAAIFQQRYSEAFASADEVLIQKIAAALSYSAHGDAPEALDTTQLVQSIRDSGLKAYSFNDPGDIQEYLIRNLREGDLVVVMSNGAFGDLPKTLPEALKQGEK